MKTYHDILLTALAVFSAGCSRENAFQRSIALEGQSNFRDIGGYETVDGKTVKTGVLYRSGRLNDLTDADVQELADLNIGTVVNFLIPKEIESAGADRVPAGTKEVLLPIEVGGGWASQIVDARKTGDFSKVPADLNPQFHVMLAEEATAQYAALIREIIASDGKPLVYHCSHGIHRTGTATAIILSAVGVSWETVRDDYLLSNVYRADEIEKRTARLRTLAAGTFGIPEDEVDMTNINAFYILQGGYVDGTLQYAEAHYGTMQNYLTEGLVLSELELKALREILLDEYVSGK